MDIQTLLYGEDPDERLVSCYIKYGRGPNVEGEIMVCVYRDEDDNVHTTEEPFYPFIFANEDCVETYALGRLRRLVGGVVPMEGPGEYNHVVWFKNYKDFRTFTQTISNQVAAPWDWFKTVGSAETQFLMQRGKTMFKGMGFNDLKRLVIDIEVYSPDGFPNPDRAEHPIFMIALRDNRGHTTLMHTGDHVPATDLPTDYYETEDQMLRALMQYIRLSDPDVIEGHNFYKFDLPYIAARCGLYDIETKLGRDNYSTLRFWNSTFKAAEKTINYPSCDIRGRHIIDTYFAALSQDVFRRDMENYSLKYLAKYFKVARDADAFVPGNKIAETWDNDPLKLLQYAAADAEETMAISEELSASTFYLTQMVPHSYGKVARSGQSAKIEPLFVREYLRRKHAVPKPEEGHQESGGLVKTFYRGVVGPILYADVESLYPSIMLNYNIQPESDDLKIFQPLLRELTKLRFEWKKEMKACDKGSDEYRKYEGMQSSAKIVINAFYGNLSTASFAFNDYSEGERVATTGQELLTMLMEFIHDDGGVVIECDTDGVMFLAPDDLEMGNREAELAYIDSLTERMPDGIIVGHDGTYEKMVSFRSKNYVLRDTEGTVKFKGSAIKSRGNEGFVNQFVRQSLKLLLDQDVQGIRDLYMHFRKQLVAREIPISAMAVTKTLKKTLTNYEHDVTLSGKHRMPQYEVAQSLAERGHKIDPGDRITYYLQSGHHKNAKGWEKARWIHDYNNDADITHYLKRLDAALSKLEPMFDRDDFRELREINTGLFPVRLEDVAIPFQKLEDEDD